LVAKITGSSFYPYMHNLFADGKERKGISKTFFDVTEKLIFNKAKEVLLLSDGLKTYYCKKYGNAFNYKIIRHSFNEKIDKEYRYIHDKGKIKYVMVGSINESNRDATVRLINTIHKIDNTELVLRSGTPQNLLYKTGLLNLCTIMPELNRAQLFDMLNSAHALLLPHGFSGKISSAEYQTIFPTKTIEYLLSGRPIIAHCSKNSFLYDFLNEYNCAYIITETDIETVTRKIMEFRSDYELQKKLVNNALIAAKIFDANVVSQALREALSNQTNKGTT
jgi:glycosyltransferase involved in cell wall biosynthesis